MFQSIFNTATSTESITFLGMLYALGTAIGLGLLISFVYMKTHKGKNPSSSFATTLVVLPAVISIIILLVGSNVARAFSLAGAFSIIRFRSTPGDPKDITYVLFSMAVGLSCGMGYLFYALVFAVIMCLVMVVLELTNFTSGKSTDKLLKITIPESLDYENAFDDIL